MNNATRGKLWNSQLGTRKSYFDEAERYIRSTFPAGEYKAQEVYKKVKSHLELGQDPWTSIRSQIGNEMVERGVWTKLSRGYYKVEGKKESFPEKEATLRHKSESTYVSFKAVQNAKGINFHLHLKSSKEAKMWEIHTELKQVDLEMGDPDSMRLKFVTTQERGFTKIESNRTFPKGGSKEFTEVKLMVDDYEDHRVNFSIINADVTKKHSALLARLINRARSLVKELEG